MLEQELNNIINQHIQDYMYFKEEIDELVFILKLKEDKAIRIVSKRYSQFLIN